MDSQPSTKAAVVDADPATTAGIVPRIRRMITAARMFHAREKIRLREEIAQIPGLMALLMKPRNGLKWTRTERKELWIQMRRLSRLSLYMVMAILPFTSLTLPLVAWWLDQRQQKRV